MWQIMIDVSGMPPEDIYVGLILFKDGYKRRFLNEFYHQFNDLRDYNRKATTIDKDYLFKVLKFFNEKKLRMVCYHFKDYQWKKHERKLNDLIKEVNESHKYRDNFYRFNEKLMGILYYYAITQIGSKRNTYYVTACAESHLDVWTVLKTIQKLAKRDGWDIRPSINIRSVEHSLKMADYVAGGNRKIEEFKLDTIERHVILSDPIKEIDLKQIFKIRAPLKYGFQKRKLFK